MRTLTTTLTAIALAAITLPAQRVGYPAEEFTARRTALAKSLGQGTVLLAGRTLPLSGVRFRQDNDFYYLTGNEDVNAVLVMDAPGGASVLFLPTQSAGEIRSDGKNWLSQGDQAKARGFTAILPLTDLSEYLARRGGGRLRPEELTPARCPLFGYTLTEMKIDGQLVRPTFLRPELQSQVGLEAYDAGARIITDFFASELRQFLTDDLDPLGRQIIEVCLRNGSVEEYAALTPVYF